MVISYFAWVSFVLWVYLGNEAPEVSVDALVLNEENTGNLEDGQVWPGNPSNS